MMAYRVSFSLSAAIHLLFFLLLFIYSTQKAVEKTPRPIWIEIDAKQSKNSRNQIVQTLPAETVKEAKPDAFLGEKNQIVEKETASRQFREATTTRPSTKTAKKADSSEKVALKNLGVPILEQAKNQVPTGQVDEPKPQWAEQGNIPQDYVKGMNESDKTLLNTKEYVFYGYFQRIRERLDRAWVPLLKERLLKLYRRGRQLASDTDHSTRVLVVLNPEGEVTRVQILTESGTADLDEAAVAAFNDAGPFPNPPRGIINSNHEVEIPWEFILKT